MLRDDRRQAALDLRERFIPGGFNKPAIAFDQRLAQTVRIFMQVLECNTFGAKIPSAEDVCRVSANAFYPPLSHGDFQTAASLTERANPMVDGFFACFDHRYSLPLLRRQVNTSKVKTLKAVVNRFWMWPETPEGVTIANVVYGFQYTLSCYRPLAMASRHRS